MLSQTGTNVLAQRDEDSEKHITKTEPYRIMAPTLRLGGTNLKEVGLL